MGDLEVYIGVGLREYTVYNVAINTSIRRIEELAIQPSKKKIIIEELEKLKK